MIISILFFFFQAEDGIRDSSVTGVQTCALPICSVDSEASGNAGIGLKSNGNSFGSYYADPETGLLYARARYYDPASGQFISRDPVEGEARLPITWGAYQYGRYNPYRDVEPNGGQSTSTL